MNASIIGERINMSVSAVIERIKKLEKTGIIKQYSAILDHKKIGKDMMAYVAVRIEHPQYNDAFSANIIGNPEILECHYITGDFDFLLKVVTNSSKDLERVLYDIRCIPGVSRTRTLVVLSTFKNDVTALPDGGPF